MEATHGSTEQHAEELCRSRAGLWPLCQQVHPPASTLPMPPPLILTILVLPLIVHSPLANASLFKAQALHPDMSRDSRLLSHEGA